MRQKSHPNCVHYEKTGCCKLFAYCQILHGVECYSQKPLDKQHPNTCGYYARRAISISELN